MVLDRKIELPNDMYICVGKFTDGLTINDIPKEEVKTMSEIIEEIKKGWKIKDSKKIKDKNSIKDAFNEDQRNAMTRYLIQEGELEEGETLEDLFGDDLENALELVYWGTQYESGGSININEFKKGVLYEWCDSDIINDITKEYLRENYPDDVPYEMDFFDEDFMNVAPWDIAKTVYFSDFNPNHKYYAYRGDGNLKSFDNIDTYLEEYKEDALKWAINKNENIDCDMYNLLEEYEDTIVLLTYFVINELGY